MRTDSDTGAAPREPREPREPSGCRWHEQCCSAVNRQIAVENWASQQYHAMFAYFRRQTVALPNVAAFFERASLEEREHMHAMVEYQSKRGGVVNIDTRSVEDEHGLQHEFGLCVFDEPSTTDVRTAFAKALEMERLVYDSLLGLCRVAEEHGDAQFADYVTSVFLSEQVESMDELSKYVAQLDRLGSSGWAGAYFDREFLPP